MASIPYLDGAMPPEALEHSGRLSLSETVANLMQAPLQELRAEWHRWHPGLSMPKGLPRDLVVQSIAWQMQAKKYGGLRVSCADS